MSAWILGREITASLGLLDFEFARECVAKGLQPHNEQPVRVLTLLYSL
jgi:hypothetical protein